MNHCIYICHMSKFQLEILKGSQDIVILMSNTLQSNFYNISIEFSEWLSETNGDKLLYQIFPFLQSKIC